MGGDHVFLLEVVFMCVLNVKGLWCLLQRSAKSACVWFSVHAVCSCNPGCEENSYQNTNHSHCTAMCVLLTLYSHVCFTHTVQPCVFYSHCTAMCVFYWVSVRDDDISLGRACDWIDSSADCLTDLFLSTVYINITIMKTMFTSSLFESFLAANFFFLILAVLVSVCLYGTH